MDNDIKPGYAVQASEADYAALARVVSEHNAAAVTGERYWGIALDGGSYTVYAAGTVPPPPTAEELVQREKEQQEAQQRQEALDKLPQTLGTLQKENTMFRQCLLEMSETVYA